MSNWANRLCTMWCVWRCVGGSPTSEHHGGCVRATASNLLIHIQLGGCAVYGNLTVVASGQEVASLGARIGAQSYIQWRCWRVEPAQEQSTGLTGHACGSPACDLTAELCPHTSVHLMDPYRHTGLEQCTFEGCVCTYMWVYDMDRGMCRHTYIHMYVHV